MNDKVLNTGETIINYSKEKVNALDLEKKNKAKTFVDDNLNTSNKNYMDSEEKEIGELNDEQKQKLNSFFKEESSKKLDNMIKGARRGNLKWQ